MVRLGRWLGSWKLARSMIAGFFGYRHTILSQRIMGIRFENPVGLAGGFDKNAELTDIIPSVGFGFEEVGSITGEACEGNPKPRLWRLPKSKSIAVYYGLKNDGARAISTRLKEKTFSIPIGINIAKTNTKETVETEAGIRDYEKAFTSLKDIGNYMTINISCPNAFGGEPFTRPDALDKLLHRLDSIETDKPIFLKISPDLSPDHVDALIDVARKHRVHGFICSNLTKNRKKAGVASDPVPEKGGLSGKAVEHLANDLIRYVYKKTNGAYIIIGCGGIFSAEDAYKKIRLGASLVQLITGMIFEGPQAVSSINMGLVSLLKRDGYQHISEAIGVDAP